VKLRTAGLTTPPTSGLRGVTPKMYAIKLMAQVISDLTLTQPMKNNLARINGKQKNQTHG
jgi:hypothetical protein